MSLLLDDDQLSLAATLRSALDRQLTDAEVWQLLSDDLELTGIGIPDSLGGAGGGYGDLAVVFTELGRAVSPDPLLPHAIGVHLLSLIAASPQIPGRSGLESLLSDALTGELRLGVSLRPVTLASAHPVASRPTTMSTTAITVLGSADSDAFVLPVGSTDNRVFVVVRADDPRVDARPSRTLDLQQPHSVLTLTDAPVQALGSPTINNRAWTTMLRIATLAVSALQVGGASRALDDAVEYSLLRYQFGRQIGSFQAVKHQLSSLYGSVHSAEIAVRGTAHALEYSPDDIDTRLLLALMQTTASETYVDAAHRSLQIHGGIGFTMETDCHLHVRRAHASRALLGPPQKHRATLGELLLNR